MANAMQKDEFGFYTPVWPLACPAFNVQADVLSVSVGNTNMVWGLHLSYENDYVAKDYWRTSASLTCDNDDDMDSDGDYKDDDDNYTQGKSSAKAKKTLSDFLFEGAKKQLFGSSDFTTSSAAQYRYTQKRVPFIYLYVISTNARHASTLISLFSGIPCIIYRLSAKDFIELPVLNESGKAASSPTTMYDGIGVDRVANIVGAKAVFKDTKHLLVIDGGTALTYTTTVQVKNVDHANISSNKTSYRYQIGGGIGLGLQMKFRSLFDYTHDVPFLDLSHVTAMIEECTQLKRPLPLFISSSLSSSSTIPAIAGDSEHDTVLRKSILASVMTETALLLCSIISKWLKIPRHDDTPNGTKGSIGNDTNQLNNDAASMPMVVLTGGDSASFELLLRPRHSYICETNESNYDLLNRAIMGDDDLRTQQDKNEATATTKTSAVGAVTIKDRFRVNCAKGLQSQAVAHMLLLHAATNHTNDVDDDDRTIDVQLIRNQLPGLRVARQSNRNKGNVILGTIVTSHRGNQLDDDTCMVIYDSETKMHSLTIREVYDALQLFVHTPEKSRSKDESLRIGLANRRKDAEDALAAIRTTSPKIQKMIELQKPVDTAVPILTVENFDEKMALLKRKNADNASKLNKRQATVDPKSYINKKIAKRFEIQDETGKMVMALFFGTVKSYVEKERWWHIEYDDGDNEDMSINELTTHLQLYEANKSQDTN